MWETDTQEKDKHTQTGVQGAILNIVGTAATSLKQNWMNTWYQEEEITFWQPTIVICF